MSIEFPPKSQAHPYASGSMEPQSDPRVLKVYLASSFKRKNELVAVRSAMESTRMVWCTSSWLSVEEPKQFQPIHVDSNIHREGSRFEFDCAKRDRDDIRRADVIALQSEEHGQYTTGGRIDEWGYAKGINDACAALTGYAPLHRILVGRRENIFHIEPDIILVSDWDEALKVMVKMASDIRYDRGGMPIRNLRGECLLRPVRSPHLSTPYWDGESDSFDTRMMSVCPNRYRADYRHNDSHFSKTIEELSDKEKEIANCNQEQSALASKTV